MHFAPDANRRSDSARRFVLVLILLLTLGACSSEPNEGPGECDESDSACARETEADLPLVVGMELRDGIRELQRAGFNIFVRLDSRSIEATPGNLRRSGVDLKASITDQDPRPEGGKVFFRDAPVYLSVIDGS